MKTTGRATSFVTGEDHQQLRDIERLLGHAVPLAAGSTRPATVSHARARAPHQNERPSSGRPTGFRDRRRVNHGTTQSGQPARGIQHQ
jgi:ATP-dependent RNA helicase RhlE